MKAGKSFFFFFSQKDRGLFYFRLLLGDQWEAASWSNLYLKQNLFFFFDLIFYFIFI